MKTILNRKRQNTHTVSEQNKLHTTRPSLQNHSGSNLESSTPEGTERPSLGIYLPIHLRNQCAVTSRRLSSQRQSRSRSTPDLLHAPVAPGSPQQRYDVRTAATPTWRRSEPPAGTWNKPICLGHPSLFKAPTNIRTCTGTVTHYVRHTTEHTYKSIVSNR